MNKKTAVMMALAAALAFGLGALSESVVADLRYEFKTRELRELVNRDLMRNFSPSGERYFFGRADANGIAAQLDYSEDPYLPEYLLGIASGLVEASDLISRAKSTGRLEPVVKP